MMSEPNNRQPIYGESKRSSSRLYKVPPSFVRIASCPNGQWQCQRHNGTEGSRTCDPWRPLQNPTTFEHADAELTSADKEERKWFAEAQAAAQGDERRKRREDEAAA
jgi:hypothetical protein